MKMIDVTDLGELSVEDLLALEKKCKEERANRESLSKDDTGVYGKLFDLIYSDLVNEGVGRDMAYSPISKMEKSVFALCDITLGNYKIAKRLGDKDVGLSVNGSRIFKNQKEYRSMADEIVDVVVKYKTLMKAKEDTNES